MRKLIKLGERLPPRHPAKDTRPDWAQANPRWIERAVAANTSRPETGWYVLGASRALAAAPRPYRVAGQDLVAFRSGEGIVVGPDACPHMGASLSCGRLEGGEVICPWHGLALGDRPHGAWRPLPTFDDGVLLWARLGAGDAADRPVIPERPARFVDGVIRIDASCEPEDVIANRLDPWHGVHFHPYSFARLEVIDIAEDEVTVRVAKRVLGPLAIEVEARFHCTGPRTVVMTIVRGEGAGSVVETHATPIEPGRTTIIEASLAASGRRGFAAAVALSRIVRPFIERSARRLWLDDVAYAERRYQVRRAQGSGRVSASTQLR
jgi:isorenieratene synthase